MHKTSYANFAKGKDGSEVYYKNVFLILRAKEDWNGALQSISLSEAIQLENQNECQVVCRDVGTLREFSDVIEELTAHSNRIKVLEIKAHGNSERIRLGRDNSECLITKDSLSLIEAALRKIEENATIVLHSCKTGYVDDLGSVSIAQSIAEAVIGRTVIAPTTEVSVLGYTYDFKPFNVQLNRFFQHETVEKIVDLLNCHLMLCGFQLKGSVPMNARFRSYSFSSPV